MTVDLALFALRLLANAIREAREQQCTCDTYWHYPLDHNAGCPVAQSAVRSLPTSELTPCKD